MFSFSLLRSRRLCRTATAFLPMVLLGCASQGPPLPPSLHLPEPARNLTAQRVGNQVALEWVTPAKTTDGELIRSRIAASICLDAVPAAAPLSARKPSSGLKRGQPPAAATAILPCHSLQQLQVVPGVSHAVLTLPAALVSGAPVAVAFSVELANERGRSAGPSAPVLLAAGATPPSIGELRISTRRQAVLIQWNPQPGNAILELHRTLTSSTNAAAAPRKSSAPALPSRSKAPSGDTILRPEGGAAMDSGGILDPGVRDGDTYLYTAQRVQTVTLRGLTLELRSVPSPAASFTFHDTFPPAAPIGLVSIPGGGFGETPSIDLSWESSPEPDLLGYIVYRSLAGAPFVPLNAEPIASPAFRDLHVQPGRPYTYRVTALDQRRNESDPSATATETLRR